MSVFEKFVRQCRKPTGAFGRFVGRSMNIGHSKLRHWGLEHISIDNNLCILDIGCGGGKTVNELSLSCPDGKVYGLDYSEDMVRLAKKVNRELIGQERVGIVHGNVSSLPFDDEMFDIITSFESYYFWPNLIDDLREIRRVLKPGGTLLMANEAYRHKDFDKRNDRWAKWGDMMLHTPEEYRGFLAESGYKEVEIDEVPDRNWIAVVAKK